MTVREQILEVNEQYASQFDKGGLQAAPARRFAVVTCMDARLDPARFLGLEAGDAHVIRNAGGLVTDDALRSLVISHHELGTPASAFDTGQFCSASSAAARKSSSLRSGTRPSTDSMILVIPSPG